MALMDRLIVNDGIAKVIDLGFHAFDEFFKMSEEIGFMKEAARRGVAPVDPVRRRYRPRLGARLCRCCGSRFPRPRWSPSTTNMWCAASCRAAFARGRVLRIAALPVFLKTYIDRLTFSFTDYLRNEKDSSTELHQWIRRNYLSFRELELSLILQKS